MSCTNREISDVLGMTHSDRITTLVCAVIDHGVENDVGMKEPYATLMEQLRQFLFSHVYCNAVAQDEEERVSDLIGFLFEYFSTHPEKISSEYHKSIEEDGVQRAAADYIAGMTDRFAIHCFEELFVPRVWSEK